MWFIFLKTFNRISSVFLYLIFLYCFKTKIISNLRIYVKTYRFHNSFFTSLIQFFSLFFSKLFAPKKHNIHKFCHRHKFFSKHFCDVSTCLMLKTRSRKGLWMCTMRMELNMCVDSTHVLPSLDSYL
jgi:hypothetical protein